MVFTSLVNKLWNSIIYLTSENSSQDNNPSTNVEQTNVEQTNAATLTFPQGAQLKNYRENKNIRGISFLNMSNSDMINNIDKARYIEEIHKRKSVLDKVAESNMEPNLMNIENFKTHGCIDRDAEYYRELNKKNRAIQVAEKNRFYCLTSKDTNISESNSYLLKNKPYINVSKPYDSSLAPWELQSMGIKTSPSILRDVNLISEKDKHILENP